MKKIFTFGLHLILHPHLHLIGRKCKKIFDVRCIIIFLFAFTSLPNPQSLNYNFLRNNNNRQWQFANGPYEATLNSISIDRINPNILYISGEDVYRSTNDGEYWSDIEPDTLLLWASIETVIKADQHNSGIVYYGGNGALFKSYNYGEHWEIIGFENRRVSSIEIDPTNSNIIYVGLDNSSNDAIWKSTDSGVTWEIITNGIPVSQYPFQNCKAIKINPLNNNSLIAAVSSEGIFKSIDGGNSWSCLWELSQAINDVEILSLDTTTILVATAGLYKSSTSGWIQIFNEGVRSIETDSTGFIYYIGTAENGIYRSTDNGNNWIQLNNGLPTSFSYALTVNDIKIRQNDDDILYVTTGVGIYKSTDKGNFWTHTFEGLKKFYAFDIKISHSNPLVIYAAGREGIHRSNNGGNSWKYIGGGAAENLIAIDPTTPDVVFIAQMPIGMVYWLWKTTDGGITWEIKLSSLTRFNFLEFDPTDPNIIYTATEQNGLAKSTDGGNTWQFINTPAHVTYLSINPENRNEFYIGTIEGVFKSTNGGLSWNYLGLPNSQYGITVLISPHNVNTLFASVYGIGFFVSTDSGITWEEKNMGMVSNKFTQIRVNPKISEQVFIGFEDAGIYVSNNLGDDWALLEPEHPSLFIDAICIDTSSSGRILASGRVTPGIYTLDSILTGIESEKLNYFPTDFVLYQNYPNPFNPITQIKYSIVNDGLVTLKIYDVLSREIKTLVNEEKQAGTYTVQFDASNFSSSIYFYSITTGDFRQTKKMILIR